MNSGTIIGIVTFVYLGVFSLSLVGQIMGKKGLARPAFFAALGGFGLHTAGILLRWYESYALGVGHVPLANFYESLVFFAWATILVTFLGMKGGTRDTVLAYVMPAAALMLGYASFSPGVESEIHPLIPALKSNWLAIHVITCFLGYASFFVASVFGIILLRDPGATPGENPSGTMFYRCVMIGFIFFTVGILTGSVWAQMAWGRYWGWDPKETWALITWLVYGAVIHEKVREGGVTKRVAVLSLIGLASVLFTYFGVNYLPGLHSYL
ncbi:MAG TPA: c-type cytochrome biogenesis protein CcsB [Deltaproteobacteria bacterium]|jgi:cytochrome c-type biogenesis protein CcsB|nr:c-type cytochrome biogenesis protein CcsB [Deltaproteobacteria bacterium]HOI08623.1 c-type cytochrome biogenesis protein CcsB [Deltaproteobacteria bacterium]